MKIHYINLGLAGDEITYTSAFIKHLIKINNLELDAINPDIVLLTVTDPHVYIALRALRKRFPKAKIVAGGFEGYSGDWMLAFVDYVVAGKGNRFFAELAKRQEIPEDLPEVYSLKTIRNKYTYPYEVEDLKEFPIIRTGKTFYQAVVGMGCHGKCPFCITGWNQRLTEYSHDQIRNIVKSVPMTSKVSLITNDYDTLGLDSRITSQSLRVENILRNGLPKAKSAFSCVRLGVEAFTEEVRKKMGKPVNNQDLKKVLHMAGNRGYSVELFMIVGLPGDKVDYYLLNDMFDMEEKAYPRVHFKFTTLNPSPHTPLWAMDLTKIYASSQKEIDSWYNDAMKLNRRIRTYPFRKPAIELFSSIVRRCYPEEVVLLRNVPDAKTEIGDFFEYVDKVGLGHLINKPHLEPMANSHIITPYRNLLGKAARRWKVNEPNLVDFGEIEEGALVHADRPAE